MLTTVNLGCNKINAEGAQYLAQALENNMVSKVFFFFITYSPLCLNTGTDHVRS
jgi:hypothetical protein